MARSCLQYILPTYTDTRTQIHCCFPGFPLLYFAYLMCNETTQSHAWLVILSATGSLWKESMQEIKSQLRYFSYPSCSICTILGTIGLLNTCRLCRSLHAVLIVQLRRSIHSFSHQRKSVSQPILQSECVACGTGHSR